MNTALLSVIYGQSIQPPAVAPTPLQVYPSFRRQTCSSYHVCASAPYAVVDLICIIMK